MAKKCLAILIVNLFFMAGGIARADNMSFDFNDPKAVNSIGIFLDSVLEPIMGVASGISGIVVFDPEKKTTVNGNIVVAADKILMANQMMTKVLHSEEWLDVEKYATVEFVFKEVISTGPIKDFPCEYVISGNMTCKGITKKIQVPVSVNYLPGKVNERNHEGEGDLLVLRSKFKIDRMAFDIKPDINPATVAKEIQLNVSIVGYAKKN